MLTKLKTNKYKVFTQVWDQVCWQVFTQVKDQVWNPVYMQAQKNTNNAY